MTKKYLVIAEYVRSVNDSDFHMVTAQQLMVLYGVSPSECVISTDRHGLNTHNLIPLRPRMDGNYLLPTEQK